MNQCWFVLTSNLIDDLWVCTTHRVDGVNKFTGLAELHEALPEVVEGSLHKDFLLLVVVQQVVPKRLLGEGLGVPDDDHTIPSVITNTRLRDGVNLHTLLAGMSNDWDSYTDGVWSHCNRSLKKTYLALVSATLRRRGSFRKPMPWCSLARTHDRMIKSFSRPWKASTLAISTCYNGRDQQEDEWEIMWHCKLRGTDFVCRAFSLIWIYSTWATRLYSVYICKLPDRVWCAGSHWTACTGPGRSADPHMGWWCQSGQVWLRLSAA